MPATKQKRPKGSQASKGTQDDRITDPRFANIQTDPRFRLPSRKDTHVRLDSRFAHMLRSDDFSSKAKVDRYGRKVPKDAGRRDLERYYRIENGEGQSDGEDEEEEVESQSARVGAQDEKVESSSDEETSDEDVSDEEVFGLDEGQDGEVPTGEVTSRIAVVNLDWDNIRSADLLAVFTSFVPSGGRILKVSIYPSDFGKERMEREEMEGPPKEIFGRGNRKVAQDESSEDSDEHDDDEEEDEKIKQSILKEDDGKEFNSASLRRYQLSRLRYFYAILVCSSSSCAEAIYKAVDGTEYLTTANFFDLRFVPDDTDFSADKPRDECERIPDGYRPNEFVTDALQHSKVRLTWDADDGSRKEAQKRAFAGSRADIDENDLKAYLGSDSEEDDDDAPEPIIVDATAANNPSDKSTVAEPAIIEAPKLTKKEAERQRMRSLLGLDAEPAPRQNTKNAPRAPVGEMQVTFTSGLSGSKGGVFENQSESDREETTVEKYVRKEKERKNRRKEKMKSSRNGVPEELAAAAETSDTGKDADAGFDDPFFDEPAATSTALKKSKKQAQKIAIPDYDPEARAQLEALTAEDTLANGSEVNHFDSTLLTKGEKLSRKKAKHKQKLSERQKAALEAKEKDNFEIDVKDPRFAAVYERPEFAIDPSHKGYKDSESMRRVLDEGRRKRGLNGEVDRDSSDRKVKQPKRRKVDDENVGELVQRVKKREKAR